MLSKHNIFLPHGKLSSIVASQRHSSTLFRVNQSAVNQSTTSQLRCRSSLSTIAATFRSLSSSELATFQAHAGDSRKAFQLFCKLNLNRSILSLPISRTCLPSPVFPVITFLDYNLSFSSKLFQLFFDSDISSDDYYLQLLVTSPFSSSAINTRRSYATISSYPLSKISSIDISAIYFQKYFSFFPNPSVKLAYRIIHAPSGYASDYQFLILKEHLMADLYGYWLPALTRPVLSDLIPINLGLCTYSSVNGALSFYSPSQPSSADRIAMLLKSIPSGDFTITTAFYSLHPRINFFSMGFAFRNSSSGKLFYHGFVNNSYIEVADFNSPSSFYYRESQLQVLPITPFIALRVVRSGSTLRFYYSFDLITWHLWYSRAFSYFITPDQYGLFINPYMSGYSLQTIFFHLFFS